MRELELEKGFFDILERAIARGQNRYPKSDKAEDVVVIEDIVYNDARPDKSKLDVYYLPKQETKEKYPVLFYIHGGGFVSGDKKYRGGVCRWHAESAGMFAVAVNYGLCPSCRFPEPLHDLFAALGWIYANAERYNLDKRSIMIAGDSAGAYYAMMMLLIQVTPRLRERLQLTPALRFGAGVLNCGVYDIESMLSGKNVSTALRKKLFKGFTGCDVTDFDRYEYRDCCLPLDYLNKRLPPLLIVHSTRDILCPGQAEILTERLTKKRIYHEVCVSERLFSNHCYPLFWWRKEAKEANAAVLSFAERFLNGTLTAQRKAYAEMSII